MTPKRRDVGSLPEPEDDHKRMRDLITENDRLEKLNEQIKADLKHMIMYVKMAPHVTVRGRRDRAEYAARLERRYFD